MAGAADVVAALAFLLPHRPITQANFQTYAAPAAYLKNAVYYFPLALICLLPTYHYVLSRRRFHQVSGRDDSERPRPKVIYLSPATLGWLFVVLLAVSLWMMTHLLDNLIPAPGMLLFQVLLWVKLAIFVCLILEVLWWYKQALEAL